MIDPLLRCLSFKVQCGNVTAADGSGFDVWVSLRGSLQLALLFNPINGCIVNKEFNKINVARPPETTLLERGNKLRIKVKLLPPACVARSNMRCFHFCFKLHLELSSVCKNCYGSDKNLFIYNPDLFLVPKW